MTLIKIARCHLGREVGIEEIEADLHGIFAVHSTWRGDDDEFTLTHVPTGYAFLTGVTKANAEAAADELNNGTVDWTTVTTPKKLTIEHKRQGRDIRERYEHRSC